jgi:hypothetical protein
MKKSFKETEKKLSRKMQAELERNDLLFDDPDTVSGKIPKSKGLQTITRR